MRAMARPAVLAALCLAALSSHCAWAAGQSPRGDRFMNSGCVWHLRRDWETLPPRADSLPAGAVSNRQGSQRATDKCTFVYKARHRFPRLLRLPRVQFSGARLAAAPGAWRPLLACWQPQPHGLRPHLPGSAF